MATTATSGRGGDPNWGPGTRSEGPITPASSKVNISSRSISIWSLALCVHFYDIFCYPRSARTHFYDIFPALPNVAYSAAPNTLCRAPRLDRITIWRKKSNHSLFGAPFAEYAVAYSASKSLIRPLATPIRQLSSLIRRPFVAYSAAK